MPGNSICHSCPGSAAAKMSRSSCCKRLACIMHSLSDTTGRTSTRIRFLLMVTSCAQRQRGNHESVRANSLPQKHVIRAGTWEQLLVFQSEFAAYNMIGMQQADPQALRWCSAKQCIDYTPFVTKADWSARFWEQRLREMNASVLRAEATYPHAWVSLW